MPDDPKPIPPRNDNPKNRREWFLHSRRLRDGTLPHAIFSRGSAQRKRLERVPSLVRAFDTPATPPPPIAPYWTPLGPSVVAHGQAKGNPPVSGRVTSIAAGPGGRVYIGTANGGVWFSADSGVTWTPIDRYALPPETAALAHMEADSLATGAVAVSFGATAAADTIYVGTGEARTTPSDKPFGDSYFGVGIKSSPSGGTAPVWTLEATNLAGHGIYKIAIDPATPSVVLAATTHGLYLRPPGGAPAWTEITTGLPAAGKNITDVIVAGLANNKAWFASVWGGQVFFSTDAHTDANGGTWTAIPGLTATGRVVLAASEPPAGTPPVVYALVDDGTLWRLDSPTGSFSQVQGVPKALFFGGQGNYDIVLGVDPSNASTVYFAGDIVYQQDWNLSFYRGTITGVAPNYTFPFNSANDKFVNSKGVNDSSKVPNDPTWIGAGVHPDAHAFVFAQNADGTHDPSNVWIGCDGGVFQSTQSGQNGSFQSRNLGLAVTQLTFIAHHPDTDAVLFAGAQDQGSLRFRGDSVCFEDPEGDGGGIVYDPTNGYRVMQQYVQASLSTSTDGGASGNWTDLKATGAFPPVGASPTVAQQAAVTAESKATGFYAPIAAVALDATHSLAVFGTNRPWVTPDWGATWTTLPTNTNPYAGGAVNAAQDVLDGSPVTALAWASPTRLFIATANGVWRFDQAAGTWTATALPIVGLPAPASLFITAIAIENAATGTLYAAVGGANVDHVWYFDPAPNTWVTAQLAAATLDVPAHTILVDPVHTDLVYLGTDVGVFKGVKTAATWAWTLFSERLPECAVTDLELHPKTRILRAATHGLGAWEIPVEPGNVPDPDLYLRVNSADSGRAPRPAWLNGLADPNNQGATLDLTSSADIKALRSSGSTLSSTPDFLGYASLRSFAQDLNTVDTLGANQIFIEVHNRGKTSVTGDQVRVLLLLADGTAPPPDLPADFATRIQNGDTTNWLDATGWRFADSTTPYRNPPSAVDVRLPQVVQFNTDFVVLGFSPNKICAAAFVSAPGDPLTSTETTLTTLMMADKHVAMRTLETGVDWRVVLGIVVLAVGIAAAIVIIKEA